MNTSVFVASRLAQALVLTISLGAAIASVTGCAVARDQQSVGEYIDDAGITIAVKARLADNPLTSAIAISVETLNGEVQLSGFAKSELEKESAAKVAADTLNVRTVKNHIVVRP
ncbi:BON domain-containing protein [Lampropedia puyangensis]|uniref:BON domain-containing protein n=1 Tax=Lampropedia puyangensis TaxID=1330072 RepID=A0A4S8FGK0_9BURK|nr:BON domain-containing protein [Lampropedia puyangensis]THU05012.1 BON domain-containing protein [Lampropedia puyangensis]